ncbi:prepilin-type N-terminal cleavage/methylation domain-containing protein [Leptolyngbya sp. AN10]|uniref:prepilin-type N-terminal cleavage/methylation domain-containing protein n=1 Tax=Leptolyngbya sp. AN10 TaxID=3423365 RepID=UPI003D3200B0
MRIKPNDSRNSSTKGLTLIEVLVCLMIGGTLLLIIGGIFSGGSGLWIRVSGGLDRANNNLATFSKEAGLTPISCVGQDTDGDKYVSCSAKNSQGEITRIECAYGFLNSGCKLPQFPFPVQGNPQQNTPQ